VIDGNLAKNKIVELALKLDKGLLKLLLGNDRLKEHFFQDVDGTYVFDKQTFQKFISNKEFLPDSYTAFKNKIGLSADGENYFVKSNDVSLIWPYKDCVLEGGQTKEDAKRTEIFWNKTLAPDQIDRLLDPKALTNFKKFDEDGEQDVNDFSIEDNYVIKGNNLLALHSLRKVFAGRVKLIYIDPPYNTGNDEFGYNDKFNHSTWYTFIKNRIKIAKDFLAKDGFLFVQIDDNEFAYLKVLLDEIFGRENFQTSITVKMSHLSGVKMAHKEKKLPKIKEHILMYAKNDSAVNINPVYTETNWVDALERYNSFLLKKGYGNEECDKWKRITVNQALEKFGIDKNDEKTVEKFKIDNADLIFRTAINRSSDYSDLPEDKFTKIDKEDGSHYFVYKSEDVNFASDKIREIAGEKTPVNAVGDIWTDIGINNLSNEGGVDLRFGKKPEKLIERIIQLTTDQNDLVLDFFLGSGTTTAVALKMDRRFVGIEQLDYNENGSVQRLKNVIDGEQSGVSKNYEWKGGGSFVYGELMEFNAAFVNEIEDADSKEALQTIWQRMQENAFLSYKVDPKDINEEKETFDAFSLNEQKQFLVEVLDKNQLYVNYSEIEDEDYGISEKLQKLNNEFYSMK
jgi:adenine-specific DNA-methyltransferase